MAKRIGLARTQALIEGLRRELKIGGSNFTGEVAQGTSNTAISFGCKKIQAFAGTLAGVDGTGTSYSDNDILCYLGALDITVPAGLNSVSKVLIDKVTLVVQTAAGTTLAGNIAVGTVASEETNDPVTGAVEIFGAGATQLSPEGYATATTATEVDINFNSAGLAFCRPSITVESDEIHLYARTTTALAADASAGRFNVLVEYTVL